MKSVLFFMASLVFTLVVAFSVNYWLQGFNSPGYVLMGIGHWSLESTLAVFITTFIGLFFILYYFCVIIKIYMSVSNTRFIQKRIIA